MNSLPKGIISMDSCQPHGHADVAELLLKCHQLEKEVAASADLSVDEFHCLGQLYVHEPCCVKDLCELLGIHATRASRLLHNLEKRGYITRSLGFSDKRKEQVTLTPDGLVAARGILQSSTLAVNRLAALLPVEAVKHLVSLLGSGESNLAQHEYD